jgi:hypothetical protein
MRTAFRALAEDDDEGPCDPSAVGARDGSDDCDGDGRRAAVRADLRSGAAAAAAVPPDPGDAARAEYKIMKTVSIASADDDENENVDMVLVRS